MAAAVVAAGSSSAQIAACWPGREQQISQLHAWLTGPAASHVVVHGPPGTGKTSIVRHCLEAWGRRFAYVADPGESKLRQLMATLLSQLWGLKRKRDAGWGPPAGADCWNTFAEQLARICPPEQPYSLLVLDNLEWHSHKHWLNHLLAAIKWQRASVAVVAICQCSPQDLQYGSATGLGLPLLAQVAFPAYNKDQLTAALLVDRPQSFGRGVGPGSASVAPWHPQQQPPLQGRLATIDSEDDDDDDDDAGMGGNRRSAAATAAAAAAAGPSAELYEGFLSACVVDPFSPMTRSVADLQVVAGWLWPAFSQRLHGPSPQVDPRAPHGEVLRRLVPLLVSSTLFKAVKEQYRPGTRDGLDECLRAAGYAPGSSGGLLPATSAGPASGGGLGVQAGGGDGGGVLAVNMGKSAKLLLLAAFIASRNKPTLDKELFDFKTAGRRGRRRGDRQEADRQAEAAKEARLKGPHTFPLTRLTSIFHRLWAATVSVTDEEKALGGGGGTGGGPSLGLGNLSSGPGGPGSGAADHHHLHLDGPGGSMQQQADDGMDIDLATGFAGGRSGLEAAWAQSGQVLSAVTGLQEMGLIMRGGPGEDPLEQPRYTCAIDEPLAQQLAADVRLKLNNYLMYDR